MTQATADRPQTVTEVTPEEVRDMLAKGECVLLDVREPDEHARERIEGATLAPLSAFAPDAVCSATREGKRLVVHCRSGRRSADAARMLAPHAAGKGVPVASLAGGIEAWKRANLPVRVNERVSAISVMRQVQLVIGLGVLAGSALAWFVHPAFVAIPAFFGAGLTFAGATGTCALASLLAAMPWNKGAKASGDSCATGRCG